MRPISSKSCLYLDVWGKFSKEYSVGISVSKDLELFFSIFLVSVGLLVSSWSLCVCCFVPLSWTLLLPAFYCKKFYLHYFSCSMANNWFFLKSYISLSFYFYFASSWAICASRFYFNSSYAAFTCFFNTIALVWSLRVPR